ncbi:hypothetical protein [Conexibacter sp. SYSU D00693]|uniref:hypothetical protein n=1 Tax=Conexibacter sp. SYSU D00693 TaxID=2812560 RepID=UPI00196B71EA|nr:hypothetical protein [Conexibacter sp. SYSU D00693]
MRIEVDDRLGFAVTWTVADELMQRSSHALVDDGRVWLVDPVDAPEALAAVEPLGEPAGVLQLLDRHNRDGDALAQRLGVPFHRLPETAPAGAPFEVHRTVWVPGWRELRLWWPARRALVVSEALGTAPYFAAGRAAGVHPFLRGLPPKGLRRHADAQALLVGHGPTLVSGAGAAIDTAIAKSRVDLPKAALAMVRGAVRRGGS